MFLLFKIKTLQGFKEKKERWWHCLCPTWLVSNSKGAKGQLQMPVHGVWRQLQTDAAQSGRREPFLSHTQSRAPCPLHLLVSFNLHNISGTSSKESTCQCSRRGRCGFDSWVRKIPGEGNDNPRQYSCLENSPWTKEPGRLYSPESRMWLKYVYHHLRHHFRNKVHHCSLFGDEKTKALNLPAIFPQSDS